jgi:hypothetical protein
METTNLSLSMQSDPTQDDDKINPLARSYRTPQIEETEAVLANALIALSMEERTQVYEDVHGVSETINESAEFLSQKLAEFDLDISVKKTDIYNIAARQSKDYVENIDFRLMLLRSTLFDVPAATTRLMKFLAQKAIYFGEGKLSKEITLLDLSADDLHSLESGAFQILPERDRSGRVIIVVFPRLIKSTPPENPVGAFVNANISTVVGSIDRPFDQTSLTFFVISVCV